MRIDVQLSFLQSRGQASEPREGRARFSMAQAMPVQQDV
jgi:hypothetical protein